MIAIASADSSFSFTEINLDDAFGMKVFASLVSEKTLETVHFDGKRNMTTLHYKGGMQVVIRPHPTVAVAEKVA